MTNLVVSNNRVPAMTSKAIAKVRKLENFILQHEQFVPDTDHVIHGGMYCRTIVLPGGMVLAGALIKVPTTLIVNGKCRVYLGDKSVDLEGYHVLAASAGRKQAFVTFEETQITMIFATDAQTVEEAENQFTDDADRLMSRRDDAVNTINITGE